MNILKYTNRFIKSGFVGITCLACFSSCNYLDVIPPAQPDMEDTMTDKAATLGFLFSCYAPILEFHTYNINYLENGSDETLYPLTWSGQCQKIQFGTANTTDGIGMWYTWYSALGQVHRFLQQIDILNPVGVTEDDKDEYKGECYFLDAYYHFRLLNTYGPIPIVSEMMDPNITKNEMPGRSHFDYCVKYIVDKLDQAAYLLPDKRELSDAGRADATICKCIKARVLLYAASPLWNGGFPFTGWKNTNYETPGYGKELVSLNYSRDKWVRAKTACQEALDLALAEGGRALFDLQTSESLRTMHQLNLPNIPGTSDDFKKKVMQMRYMMCSAETEGNREVIWGIVTDRLSTNAVEAVPHWVVTKNDGSAWGGVCAMSPLLYAVEHFYTADGKLPENDSQLSKDSWFESARYAGFTTEAYSENNPFLPAKVSLMYNKREPRFYAWLSFDGDEFGQKICDGSPLIVQVRNSLKQGYNPSKFNRDNCTTGYFLKKWAAPDLTFRKDGGYNYRSVPTPFIRLAELYLSLAECHAALGEQQPALDNLNEVRERAGISAIGAKDLNEMPLMDWIRNERFVELFAEGHRYYDARRWMIAPQLFKAGVREGLNAIEKENPTFEEFNRRTKVDQPFQWDDRMYLLPVNASEIYNNPHLKQAPKY